MNRNLYHHGYMVQMRWLTLKMKQGDLNDGLTKADYAQAEVVYREAHKGKRHKGAATFTRACLQYAVYHAHHEHSFMEFSQKHCLDFIGVEPLTRQKAIGVFSLAMTVPDSSIQSQMKKWYSGKRLNDMHVIYWLWRAQLLNVRGDRLDEIKAQAMIDLEAINQDRHGDEKGFKFK